MFRARYPTYIMIRVIRYAFVSLFGTDNLGKVQRRSNVDV